MGPLGPAHRRERRDLVTRWVPARLPRRPHPQPHVASVALAVCCDHVLSDVRSVSAQQGEPDQLLHLVRGGSHDPRALAGGSVTSHGRKLRHREPRPLVQVRGGLGGLQDPPLPVWSWVPRSLHLLATSEKHFVSCWSRIERVSPAEVPSQALAPPCHCLGPGDPTDLHPRAQRPLGQPAPLSRHVHSQPGSLRGRPG